jgi:hypothetical protein
MVFGATMAHKCGENSLKNVPQQAAAMPPFPSSLHLLLLQPLNRRMPILALLPPLPHLTWASSVLAGLHGRW